jgi:hypothetical protein
MHTALILGAGFSKPYGFPLGGELKDQLIDDSINGVGWGEILTKKGLTDEDLSDFRRSLIDSQADTIDQFLDESDRRPDHKQVSFIARLSIARVINKMERLENLHSKIANDPSLFSGCYQRLINYLVNNSELSKKPEKDKLSIITFNYDKSLDHSIYLAFYSRTKSIEESTRLTKETPIYHIHGDLGPLFWESSGGRQYEPTDNAESVIAMSDYFTTSYNDMKLSNIEKGKMESDLKNADQILILGFGYSDNNLTKMNFHSYTTSKNPIPTAFWGDADPVNHPNRKIIGSSVGMNKERADQLRDKWNIGILPLGKNSLDVLTKWLFT